MSEGFLREVACPNCLSAIDIRAQSRHVTCEACGSQFLLEGHFCPNCNAYHEENQNFCQQCGTLIMRVCRRCHTNNWAGNEYCKECGAAMDIIDLLSHQHGQARQEAEVKRHQTIKNLREQEEAASAKRMAELMAIEEERVTRLHARQQRQKQRDLQLFIIAAVLFLLLMIASFWLISMLG